MGMYSNSIHGRLVYIMLHSFRNLQADTDTDLHSQNRSLAVQGKAGISSV